MEDRIVGGIISSVLGDALGVPVEFEDRKCLRKNPVHDFLEFGTYNQPKGTWSDDSSLETWKTKEGQLMNKALFHIPHYSKYIPLRFRDQFLLTKEELRRELLCMTDYKTDKLFYLDEHQIYIKGIVSRLVADLERFPIDEEEPMSKVGMGAVYRKTSDNKPLRRELVPEEKNYLMNRYYYKHHNTLNEAVKKLLEENGTVILFDCHSFSSHKLPYEQCTSDIRPDICIGSDGYHTPKELAEFALRFFQERGYETALNIPFAGSLVPSDYYQKNKNVISIMIEVNRRLYMNEAAGRISKNFMKVKTDINQCCRKIIERTHSGGF